MEGVGHATIGHIPSRGKIRLDFQRCRVQFHQTRIHQADRLSGVQVSWLRRVGGVDVLRADVSNPENLVCGIVRGLGRACRWTGGCAATTPTSCEDNGEKSKEDTLRGEKPLLPNNIYAEEAVSRLARYLPWTSHHYPRSLWGWWQRNLQSNGRPDQAPELCRKPGSQGC